MVCLCQLVRWQEVILGTDKSIRCEADRLEDSMVNVDLSQMVGKMPATKV